MLSRGRLTASGFNIEESNHLAAVFKLSQNSWLVIRFINPFTYLGHVPINICFPQGSANGLHILYIVLVLIRSILSMTCSIAPRIGMGVKVTIKQSWTIWENKSYRAADGIYHETYSIYNTRICRMLTTMTQHSYWIYMYLSVGLKPVLWHWQKCLFGNWHRDGY